MPSAAYEIRVCTSCGLRYPHPDRPSSQNGMRCPACLAETRIVRRVDGRRVAVSTRSQLLERERADEGRELAVLLDNVRSAWNVGSILRSADGFGFVHAYLCGITPAADHDAVRKTSLGAEESVAWSHHKDAVRLVESLKADRWSIVVLEEDAGALELGRFEPPNGRALLVVGSEVTGVDPDVLSLCDAVVHIPMRGRKSSFNVAIAFGIAAYALGQ